MKKAMNSRGFGDPLGTYCRNKRILVYNTNPVSDRALMFLIKRETTSLLEREMGQQSTRSKHVNVSEVSVCPLAAYARFFGYTQKMADTLDGLMGANTLGISIHEGDMDRLKHGHEKYCLDWRDTSKSAFAMTDQQQCHQRAKEDGQWMIEFERYVSKKTHDGIKLQGHVDIILWNYTESEDLFLPDGRPAPYIIDIKTSSTKKFQDEQMKASYLSQVVFYAMLMDLPLEYLYSRLLFRNPFKDVAPYKPILAYEVMSPDMIEHSYERNLKIIKRLNYWNKNNINPINCKPPLPQNSNQCQYYCWFSECVQNAQANECQLNELEAELL